MLRRNVAVHHCVFNAEIPSNNGTQSDLQSVFAKVSVTFQVLRYNLLKKFRIHPNHSQFSHYVSKPLINTVCTDKKKN